jgi:hypothetical protein
LCETLRIKGCLLQHRGDLDEVEACFQEAIDVAREQLAKSWELRAATSYARLLKDQGRSPQARSLLEPVYDWFTEGRCTRDHLEVKGTARRSRSRCSPSECSTNDQGLSTSPIGCHRTPSNRSICSWLSGLERLAPESTLMPGAVAAAQDLGCRSPDASSSRVRDRRRIAAAHGPSPLR